MIRMLSTVNQFAERHPAFNSGGIRWMIFNGKPRINSAGEEISGNGLLESGAIVRLGRRVLIDEDRFFRWVEEQQSDRKSGGAERLGPDGVSSNNIRGEDSGNLAGLPDGDSGFSQVLGERSASGGTRRQGTGRRRRKHVAGADAKKSRRPKN